VLSSSFGNVSTTLRPVLPVAPTMRTVGAMEVVVERFDANGAQMDYL
jgi:hypothetical protein